MGAPLGITILPNTVLLTSAMTHQSIAKMTNGRSHLAIVNNTGIPRSQERPAPTKNMSVVIINNPSARLLYKKGAVNPTIKIPIIVKIYPSTDALLAGISSVSYTHLRAHETRHDLVC